MLIMSELHHAVRGLGSELHHAVHGLGSELHHAVRGLGLGCMPCMG